MKAEYKFNDNDISQLNLTISITMTVDQWRHVMRIRAQNFHRDHEDLQNMISTALGDLTKATNKTYVTNERMENLDAN